MTSLASPAAQDERHITMSVAAERRRHTATRRERDDDLLERSVIWSTAGYFLLDLVALVTPPDSPLDVGQSVELLMTMLIFRLYTPIDTSRKVEVAQLVAVIIICSTVLDVIDIAFNVDPALPISLYPPVADLIISLVFLVYLGVHLCRARDVVSDRTGAGDADPESVAPMVPTTSPSGPEVLVVAPTGRGAKHAPHGEEV